MNPLCIASYPTLPKGRSRDEHRFPDRKGHFWRVLVDGAPCQAGVGSNGVILLAGGLSMSPGVYPVVGIILLIVLLIAM
jgi:hypothetical protein